MDKPTAFATFDDYRDRMLAIMAMAEQNIPAQAPQDVSALNLGRTRMSRMLTAYHLFAQRELFTPCAAYGDPARRTHIRAVEADCAALARDFRAFARDCEARPVRDRWDEYRPMALTMMGRIRAHLRAAEAEVRHCQSPRASIQPARAA